MTILEPPQQEEIPLTVTLYKPLYQKLWDNFVAGSKNGVFLFNRNYMDYHSDRFIDHSLMFFRDHKLVGLLPANLEGHALQTHAGLTFGGVVSGYNMTQPLMLEIFNSLVAHAKEQGIRQIIYKPVPYIYHSAPAGEDLYALSLHKASLIGRNVSSAIFLPKPPPFDNCRKESLRKARKHGLTVKRSYDLKSFMSLAEHVLKEKHGVSPVHTAKELTALMQSFPDNIKLFVSTLQDKMVAGIVIYESENVAHGQYAANSDIGRGIGAQDVIEDYLIKQYYTDKKYYDFGISTTKLGKELNEGLLKRKEGFGASAVNYDFYEIII